MKELYQHRVETHHHWLGLMIFVEAHQRLLRGEFGSIPTPLEVWAFAEGGYCIDAPQSLPAGACFYADISPLPGETASGFPVQIAIEREGQA